jgi:hypothetical protein
MSTREGPRGGRGPDRGWLYVAPSWLDPVLALAERVDRRRRHIRAVRPEGLLGLELARHTGNPIVLRDGTRVVAGDLVVVLHFRNERVRALATSGWHPGARRAGRQDLTALAAWVRGLPTTDRPVALRATTLFEAILRREGWDIRPRERTLRTRVDDWFMRWLVAHWSGEGRQRLWRRQDWRSVDGWLSCREFLEHYSAPGDDHPVGGTTVE